MAVIDLYNEDCLPRLRMMEAKSVDMFLFSPPYNLGVSSGGGLKGGKTSGLWKKAKLAAGYDTHSDAMPYSEYCEWQKDILRECWRILADDGVIFYQHKPRIQKGVVNFPFVDLNPDLPIRQVIIWDRGSGMNFNETALTPSHEYLVVFAKPAFRFRKRAADRDVWSILPDRGNQHPAPFPVQLATRAIGATNSRVVCDPFMGSGTTGVACVQLERDFLGIEVSPEYFEVAKQRIENASKC